MLATARAETRQNRLPRKLILQVDSSLSGRSRLETVKFLFTKSRSRARPAPTRGASRSSREVVQDAMNADVTADERDKSARRNRMVLIPRRWDQVCGR